MAFKTDMLYGNGAVQYINCGYVPDRVEVYNATDGDSVDVWFKPRFMPFTSGGVSRVFPGDKLTGDTSHATAIVEKVLLASGTWLGGDAAGFFTVKDVVGTFASENVTLVNPHYVNGNAAQANVATVTAIVEKAYNIAAAVVAVTANGINSWRGDDTNNFLGFKIGTTTGETGDLLIWSAWKDDLLSD